MPQYYYSRTKSTLHGQGSQWLLCCVCSPDNRPPFKKDQRTGKRNRLSNYKVGTVGCRPHAGVELHDRTGFTV